MSASYEPNARREHNQPDEWFRARYSTAKWIVCTIPVRLRSYSFNFGHIHCPSAGMRSTRCALSTNRIQVASISNASTVTMPSMFWLDPTRDETSVQRQDGNHRDKLGTKIDREPKSTKGYSLINCSPLIYMVGAVGFELTTLCSQSRCATRLRYAPKT